MLLNLSEIAAAVKGECSADIEITSICRDTRDIKSGSLFICLKGERFDGHSFAQKAQELGAAAILASSPIDVDIPVVMCKDTQQAILDLAGYYRSKFDIPVVGLTGSVGKTTTKEMITGVLSQRYNTLSTIGNLNNEIGVPLTLFRLEKEHTAAVIEMGMSNFGEISRMTVQAKPTIGLITNIGVSHMENLGSREGILKAKCELLDGMKSGAPLVINGDDELLKTIDIKDNPIITYSIENDSCDFQATHIHSEAIGTGFTIKYNDKTQDIVIPTIGLHNIYNALAAFAVGITLGVAPDKAAFALSQYTPTGMRQRVVKCKGITVIEDCYNASPDSVKAALSALTALPCHGRRIAVLGDMLELGEISRQAHAECGLFAAKSADVLLCHGDFAKYYIKGVLNQSTVEAIYFNEKEKLAQYLKDNLCEGDVVLVKASRGMKFEQLLEAIYERWEKQ